MFFCKKKKTYFPVHLNNNTYDSLLSNSKENPRKHLKEVTLRSGKQVEARAEKGLSAKKDMVTA